MIATGRDVGRGAQLARAWQLGIDADRGIDSRVGRVDRHVLRAGKIVVDEVATKIEIGVVQRLHQLRPDDLGAFVRTPGLSDPAWMARIRARLADTVLAQGRYRPFYYSLGDETGIADLAANWDFDFSPVALTAFRAWLERHYGSLMALNAQWETAFAAWEDVRPLTTTQAMARVGENFSPWADFKIFMDICFADAVRAGTASVHAADPAALAGLEGMQVPGWGGYDYARLAHAVDVMEIYDGGNNVEIVRSLNPEAIVLSTAFGVDAGTLHGIWHALLLGERGLILWDEGGQVVGTDGTVGPWGRAYAPLFRELTGQLGTLVVNSTPHFDPVAILYSPASFRTQWMLDHRGEGDAWSRRTAEMEGADNAVRTAMRRDAAAMISRGIQPRWVTADAIAGGGLRGMRALVLPQAIALSDAEMAAIRAFMAAGGAVLADGKAGWFDEHSRRREGALETHAVDAAGLVAALGISPVVSVMDTDGSPAEGLDIRVFAHGDDLLVGVQSARAEAVARVLRVVLAQPGWVRDVRGSGGGERTQSVAITLDPVTPTLLTIGPSP